MNLHHLRLFVITLEHGNITAAANALGVTQPALSKQLSRLEDDFGTRLLERLPRGVQATPAGKVLADHAKSVEASYRSAVRLMESVTKSEVGEVTVGAGFYWLNGVLPLAVAQLVTDFPDARVRIVGGVPEHLTGMLLEGDLDLVFAPVAFRQGHNDVIEVESLLRTTSVVLVRQGHAADDGENRTMEDLSRLPWALPRGTFIRKWFDQLFEAHGLTPPVPTVEVNDVSAALEMVAHSNLATLASPIGPTGQTWDDYGRVQCRDLAGWRDSGILRRRQSVMPALGEALCERVRALVADHAHSVMPRKSA